ALPWALKILMITLVTVAVFIYRKPFAHLFSAVVYGVIGSQERAEASLATAKTMAKDSTQRPARWARRVPGRAVGVAAAAAPAGAAGPVAGAAATRSAGSDTPGAAQG